MSKNRRLQGKVAIVTGSGTGLGEAIGQSPRLVIAYGGEIYQEIHAQAGVKVAIDTC